MGYTASQLYLAFPSTTDCSALRSQIEGLLINEAYWRTEFKKEHADASAALRKIKEEKFNLFTCELILGSKSTSKILDIGSSYDASAKAKIETDTTEAITKRLIIGASIIILALGVLLAFKKKE